MADERGMAILLVEHDMSRSAIAGSGLAYVETLGRRHIEARCVQAARREFDRGSLHRH